MTNLELAENPNTPPETLELLATDENSNVRWRVTQNPNATEEICLMVRAKEYQLTKPLLQLAH
jgi:hypothetical protein